MVDISGNIDIKARDSSFGIELSLFEKIDDFCKDDLTSRTSLYECDTFLHSINPSLCHVNRLNLICENNSIKEQYTKLIKKMSSGVAFGDKRSFYDLLYQATLKQKIMPSTKEDVKKMIDDNSDNKVDFIFGTEPNNLYQNNDKYLPYISYDDITEKGFSSLYRRTPMTIGSNKKKPKKYKLSDFFRMLDKPSKFFIIYDNYLFKTLNEQHSESFLGIKLEKEVDRELKIDFDGFKKFNMKFSMWLKNLPKDIKNLIIISKLPFGVPRPLTYIDKYKECINQRIEDIKFEIEENSSSINQEQQEIENLNSQISKIKSFKEKFEKIETNLFNSIKDDNFLDMIDDKFVINEDKLFLNNIFEDVFNVDGFRDGLYENYLLQIENIKVANSELIRLQDTDDEFTSSRIDNKVNEIKNLIEKLIKFITELNVKLDQIYNNIIPEINIKNNSIKGFEIKNDYLNIEQPNIYLIQKYIDSILVLEDKEKVQLERLEKYNLHDRVYLNDHSLISWGKGEEIFNYGDYQFDREMITLQYDCVSMSSSIFDINDRNLKEDENETQYSVFKNIVDHFSFIVDNYKKK